MEPDKDDRDLRYEDAAYAYTVGNFVEALALFSELVESGHATAPAYLSEMYLRGEGTPADVAKGLELLQLGVSRGDSNAAFNLGALYRTGAYGVPKDQHKSRQFLLRAKELGCTFPVTDYGT